MAIELPADPKVRIPIMVALSRGETVEYEIGGRKFRVSPSRILCRCKKPEVSGDICGKCGKNIRKGKANDRT